MQQRTTHDRKVRGERQSLWDWTFSPYYPFGTFPKTVSDSLLSIDERFLNGSRRINSGGEKAPHPSGQPTVPTQRCRPRPAPGVPFVPAQNTPERQSQTMAKPCCSELTHSASPETQPGQEDAFPQELHRKTRPARDMLYELSPWETCRSRAGGDRADAPQCVQWATSRGCS